MQSLYKAVFTEYLQALVTHLKRLKPRKWEDHRGQVETDVRELRETFGRQEVSPGPSGGFQWSAFPFPVCLSSPLTGLEPAVPPAPPGLSVPGRSLRAALGALGRGEAGPGRGAWGAQEVTWACRTLLSPAGPARGLCGDSG